MMISFVRFLLRLIGLQLTRIQPSPTGLPGSADNLRKGETFIERFRDVVSDPLNLRIERVPEAGYLTASGNIVLHNGIQVPIAGPNSYYGDFSQILMINRGVHEPLEEYCFQQFLKAQSDSCSLTMLELGAYWGHYSMWFQSVFPRGKSILVEPDARNMKSGETNFQSNGLVGTFINAFVSKTGFSVDSFISDSGDDTDYILHSDIQGFEVEMLETAQESLVNERIRYAFISTHSNELHQNCLEILRRFEFIIDIDSELETHTTSYDGLIIARAKSEPPFLHGLSPMGRLDICKSSPKDIDQYLARLPKL